MNNDSHIPSIYSHIKNEIQKKVNIFIIGTLYTLEITEMAGPLKTM